MGLFRIFISSVNFLNLLIILPSIDAWFSERGFTPIDVTERALPAIGNKFLLFGHQIELPIKNLPRIDLLAGITDSRIVLAFYLCAMLACFLSIFGLWSRVSTIAMAVGVVTIQHRNILILHGGDNVMRVGALYAAIAPSGKACSVDRLIGLWKGKIKAGAVLVSLWPQRLVMLNLSLIYFTTWWYKMDGSRWQNGTATWYTMRLNEFERFWYPPIMKAAWLAPIWTYGTLISELAMCTVVFWKPLRKYALLLGLGLHGFIEYSMNIPLFGWAIASWYIMFYEGEEVSEWARRLGERLRRFKLQVALPKGVAPQAGPVLCLRAMDPLQLVEFTQGECLECGDSNGAVTNMELAVYKRSVGAWFIAWLPGLWRRLFRSACEAKAT